jgi:tol-pal system protein YbgF
MIECRALKLTRFAGVIFACTLVATPAFAVNKDMVQLQTEVQDLQEAVSHLQQSNDERMGVLKDLVQQTADSINKMSVTVETLQQQMRTQQEASTGKLDQVSGQVQSLNDSLDEVKARLNNLEKSLQSVQNQQQSINAALQNMAQPAGSAPNTPANNNGPAPTGLPAAADQAATQAAAVGDNGNVASDTPPFPATQGPPTASPSGPATVTIYKTALGDYEAAKYALAVQEFNQVIRSNPADQLAGNAYYYLGEIDYRTGKFAAAVKDYDHVLDGYPGNPKIPVSHLHKGMALLALKDREGGITEFRAIIQRFPNSPEATQARSKLSGMGVRPTAPRSE